MAHASAYTLTSAHARHECSSASLSLSTLLPLEDDSTRFVRRHIRPQRNLFDEIEKVGNEIGDKLESIGDGAKAIVEVRARHGMTHTVVT